MTALYDNKVDSFIVVKKIRSIKMPLQLAIY